MSTKFEVNDTVEILPYAHEEVNRYGRVNYILADGWVHVVNMNMPYMGTISQSFHPKDLKLVKKAK